MDANWSLSRWKRGWHDDGFYIWVSKLTHCRQNAIDDETLVSGDVISDAYSMTCRAYLNPHHLPHPLKCVSPQHPDARPGFLDE
jgi:hypothetical protein